MLVKKTQLDLGCTEKPLQNLAGEQQIYYQGLSCLGALATYTGRYLIAGSVQSNIRVCPLVDNARNMCHPSWSVTRSRSRSASTYMPKHLVILDTPSEHKPSSFHPKEVAKAPTFNFYWPTIKISVTKQTIANNFLYAKTMFPNRVQAPSRL